MCNTLPAHSGSRCAARSRNKAGRWYARPDAERHERFSSPGVTPCKPTHYRRLRTSTGKIGHRTFVGAAYHKSSDAACNGCAIAVRIHHWEPARRADAAQARPHSHAACPTEDRHCGEGDGVGRRVGVASPSLSLSSRL